MQAIEYQAPKSLEQALSLLAAQGEKSRALCGGTDILIQMRAGVRRPAQLVDVKRIPELNRIVFDEHTGLKLGAAVPCIEIYESPIMQKFYPGLTEAAHLIGSVQIQSRASVGGNLCNGSPAADTTPSLIALAATAVIAGSKGTRRVLVEEVVTSPGRTVLEPGELLVELDIPIPKAHSSDAYQRFIPRNEMDIAVVGVGASVAVENSRCVACRIGLAAVAPTPVFATKAGESLVGTNLDAKAIDRACQLAIDASSPIDDMRGTAEFRRHIVGVLTRRVLSEAIARARAAR